MSPEQARGRETGPPSDIFSLGAVLAFAATGKGPFGSGSGPELLYRVVSAEPDTDGVPREVRPLVERCLVKDPRRRPTAAQLLAELSNAQADTRSQLVPTPARAGRAANLLSYLPTEAAHPAAGQAAVPEALIPTRAAPAPVPEPRPVPPAEQRPVTPPRPRPVPPAGQRPVTPPRPRFVAAPEPRPLATPQPPPPGRQPTPPPPGRQPTPPPPGRQPTPPRGRPPRRGRRVAVAVAVVLIAVVAGAFAAWRAGYLGSPGPASSPGTSTSPSAPSQSPAAVMATLGTYLAQSASVRPSIQHAIDGVRTCSQTPASGQAVIQRAINTRQDILDGLRTLSPSGLSNGARLISTLTAAMQHSVTADQAYQGWMADVASGGCGGDPSQNSHYVAGNTASAAAASAKKAFADIWNPMAPGYGQKTYSDTGF